MEVHSTFCSVWFSVFYDDILKCLSIRRLMTWYILFLIFYSDAFGVLCDAGMEVLRETPNDGTHAMKRKAAADRLLQSV